MAKTPYKDLSSQSILSAHISGLQHDINKVQDVLDMKTSEILNHPLVPVKDQEEAVLRYRIYEGTLRNWLDNPEPVVYRNGVRVNKSEYDIQSAYGVVVFHERQRPSDEITVNMTYINSESNTIININNDIDKIKQDIENIGEGGQGDVELPENIDFLGATTPFYVLSNSYMSHQKRDYEPVIPVDGTPTYNTDALRPSFNVLVYGNTIDVFPFPVTTDTTFKRAGIMQGNGDTVNVRIGLYKDNGNLYPSELIFQSPIITVGDNEWGYADIDETIPAGFYWIARHDRDTSRWNGLKDDSVIQLQRFNAETFLKDLADRPNPFATFGGYRATDIPFGDLPSVFPSGIDPFKRADYCTPWLITK